MKKVLGFALVALLSLNMAVCGSVAAESGTLEEDFSADSPIVIKIGAPKAPPALPLLYMMENSSLGDNVTIDVDIWDEPETLIAMVQGDEHQMFAFPLTVVAKLHNKGVPVQLMNVSTWGVTYFMTSDPELKNWGDLAGKKVYVPLQSSPPDALTQFFLAEAGLTADRDVEVIYAGTAEIAAMLAAGAIEYATMIEPMVTRVMMQNPGMRIVFRFEDEWRRIHKNDSIIPNAGLGVMASFSGENPELAAAFQKAYAEGLRWVNDNPDEAGALAEKYMDLKAQLIAKAIPNMGLMFKSARDAKPEVEALYALLNDFDPVMIGGKLPDATMYYNE